MQIKIRKQNPDGNIRLETSGNVKEILINEDIFHPEQESISLCFKGKNSSGIVDLTTKELETIYEIVKNRIHLIKGIKRF